MTSKASTIIEAASTGDCETLKCLLQSNPSETLQEANLTLEQLTASAANHRHADTVAYCLALGAHVNDFAVQQAVIESNSLGVYEAVVPAGFNLNYNHGIIGGHLCWVRTNAPLAKYLLLHGADPNREMQSGIFQPLALAARNPNDNVEIVELMIEHGAQIDRSGALILAAQHGNLGVVNCLIERGADVNLMRSRDTMIFKRPEQEESALHQAIRGKHEAVVALLLEKGADRELQDAKGRTALDLARELELDSLVRVLQAPA